MRRATNPLKGETSRLLIKTEAVVHDICIIWKLIKYHRRDAILSPGSSGTGARVAAGSSMSSMHLHIDDTKIKARLLLLLWRRKFFFDLESQRVGLTEPVKKVLRWHASGRGNQLDGCTFSPPSREGEQPASQNCLQTLFEEAKDTLVLLAQPILSDTSITEPQDWFSFMLTWHVHIRCMMSSNDDNCSFQDCHEMRCFRILASSDEHVLELVPCDVREGIRWLFCVFPLIAEHHTALIANKLGCTIAGIN